MVDRPQSAAIRKPSRISPALCLALGSCLAGAAIIAGGMMLAERQQIALQADKAAASELQNRLLVELSEARLTGPRLRLEELASLPLIPEYLAITADQPDSLDAKELKTYLQTVLDAASEETGLTRIALVSAEGTELLVSRNPAAGTSAGETGPETAPGAPVLEAAISSFDAPDQTAGHLTGHLPKEVLSVLPLQNSNEAEVITSATGGLQASASIMGTARLPMGTRLLAFFAGIATAIAGLAGAALLRKQQRQ